MAYLLIGIRCHGSIEKEEDMLVLDRHFIPGKKAKIRTLASLGEVCFGGKFSDWYKRVDQFLRTQPMPSSAFEIDKRINGMGCSFQDVSRGSNCVRQFFTYDINRDEKCVQKVYRFHDAKLKDNFGLEIIRMGNTTRDTEIQERIERARSLLNQRLKTIYDKLSKPPEHPLPDDNEIQKEQGRCGIHGLILHQMYHKHYISRLHLFHIIKDTLRECNLDEFVFYDFSCNGVDQQNPGALEWIRTTYPHVGAGLRTKKQLRKSRRSRSRSGSQSPSRSRSRSRFRSRFQSPSRSRFQSPSRSRFQSPSRSRPQSRS